RAGETGKGSCLFRSLKDLPRRGPCRPQAFGLALLLFPIGSDRRLNRSVRISRACVPVCRSLSNAAWFPHFARRSRNRCRSAAVGTRVRGSSAPFLQLELLSSFVSPVERPGKFAILVTL